MKLLSLTLISALFYSTNTLAKPCDVNFNYGVVINPAHIRILDKGQTHVQINGESQLFVNGREIELTSKQQNILAKYSHEIRKQVPEIVSIAIEGVEIDLKSVNKVIAGLTGENSVSHQKIQEQFSELQWRLRNRFNHSDKNYYIAPQDFEDFDDIFTGEFKQEVEEIITNSIDTILMAVGEVMTNHDENNIEQRIETFDEQIKMMAKDLEFEIGSRDKDLDQKTKQFCQNLILLDQLEAKMQQLIPQLLDYDLIYNDNN
ncbi:MAG: YggN family protein [Alteromonadaceae bacterium]|nr:YggN family protein [Alteromonadaceae bacterium]